MQVLAFDLDDTLLDSSKRIGPGTYSTLLNWLDKGRFIYLITSRPIRSVRRFIPPELLTRASVITLNGAVIYDLDGQIHQTKTMGDSARKAVNYLMARGSVHLTVEILGEHFASNISLPAKQLWEVHSASVDMLLDLDKVDYDSVVKVAIDGQGRQLADELTWLRTQKNLNPIAALNNTFINLVPKTVDKSAALVYLADKHGIDISQTVVFGDDEPDLGMMRAAGLAVAMANATPEVKAIADVIIGHHDDDSIGYFIDCDLGPLVTKVRR